MTDKQHSLFNGPFYMEGQYALSLIPSLIKYFETGTLIENKDFESEAKNKAISLNQGSGSTSTQAVAIINIKQPIAKFTDRWYGILGSKAFVDILESYKNNDAIAGVVLDIDSGGGQVYGTPEFFDYIKNYSKPVVTYTDGYLCSAAYYIGSAASYIVANKRADHIGSIGAYASFVDGRGFLEKFGAKVHTLYATKSTEKNGDYREILDNNNYEPYIKNQLDPIVETFHSDMKSVRPQLKADVFKGGTWNGEDALSKNLVDELGTIQTAVDKVFELANKNSTTNKSTMSKDRKQLQTVLGLDGPLAATQEHGSYLNEDQLDSVEQTLEANATAVIEAQQAEQQARETLTQEQAAATQVETQINALATLANVEKGSTVAGTMANLENRINELQALPGAIHTSVGTKEKDQNSMPEYVDLNNSVYSQIRKN